MKTIAVSNGDIQLNSGKIQFIVGQNKLVQDLTLWLEEPLGTGYTTPNVGSLLPGMIGGTQNGSTISSVKSEINRVLQLYMVNQVQSLQLSQNSSQLSNWNKSEIIQSITSVNVSIQNTTIIANINLLTMANSNVNLNVYIDNNGVSVNG